MANVSYERQLEDLAGGEDWSMDHLSGLVVAVANVQGRELNDRKVILTP